MQMAKGLRTPKGPASPPYTNGPYEWSEAVILNKPMVEGSNRYVLVENFEQRPGLNASVGITFNPNFEILGTNAAEANVTWGAAVGGIEMKTAGADDDQVIVLPHLDSNQTAWTEVNWGTENQVIWEAVIKTDSDVTKTLYWLGLKLTNTPTIATDNDQAFFRFSTDDSDENFECVVSVDGTDETNDSGVEVEASTIYYLRVEIDSNRYPHFFINNKEVYRGSQMKDDVDLIPYVGVQALESSAKHLYLSKEKISRYVYE